MKISRLARAATPRSLLRLLTGSTLVFAALLTQGRAWAAEPAAAEEPPESAVPFEQNLVAGHLQLSASASYALPFGRLSEEQSRTDRSRGGGLFSGEAAIGLDRFIFLGAYGEYGLYQAAKGCDDCSASSWGAGLQVAYHVVQGLRIDPWISYGVGYRQFTTHGAQPDPARYHSLEWMRLGLGTDWYVTSGFAVSPFALFGVATTLDAPSDESGGATDLRFQFGLRLLLDFPGR
jgi:hypothetical protein